MGDVIRAGYDRSFDQWWTGARPRPRRCTATPPASASTGRPTPSGCPPASASTPAAWARASPPTSWPTASGPRAPPACSSTSAATCAPSAGALRATTGPSTSTRGHRPAVGPRGPAPGGLATSTVLRRRWRIDGRPQHHVIDPRTGAPADTGVVAATALARTAWQAEVLAKAALARPLDEALALVSGIGAGAVLVDDVGGLHPTPGFEAFRVPATPAPTPAPTDDRS
ncbi:MAG: FAD:protein FMN transferase [Acidimicrobiales bacterium]